LDNDQHIDERILNGCLNKQPKSQRALVDKYAGYLLATCKRYMKDSETARDLVQDSLIKIFKNLDKFDSKKGNFKSWITTISIRLCLSKLKKQNLIVLILDSHVESTSLATSIQFSLDNLDTAYLLDMIMELPNGYREVFNLYVIDGYSHAEIAELLNISSDLSRSRLVRARNKLKSKIVKLKKEELWINSI